MIRKLLISFFILSLTFGSQAQRFDYDSNSKLFFGLNIGRTWHSSDVKNVTKRFPLGAGFILGGSVNQDYGKAVSFDIRLRYLGGNWYGQDTDTTSSIQDNQAVNALYDTLGYTVQNFKATQHRLALELSIHANRFKENTGFDPYIFAGIGITGTRTKADLLQKTDLLGGTAIYPYQETPNGNIIDQEYNSFLDKNEAGDPYQEEQFETNIMPSLGVGIGYYFNSRFSLGIEHKSTFFMGDYFDGTTLNQEGGKSSFSENDIYHYSGIYLKWYLKSSKDRTTLRTDNDVQVPNQPVTEDRPNTGATGRKNPPVVKFTNPSSTPTTTSRTSFTIRARTEHVSKASDLTFTRNGVVHNTFIFNPMSRSFESKVQLERGENVFKLVGKNEIGTDEDQVVIIYKEREANEIQPPIVNVVDPAVRPKTVNQLNYIVRADIQNIQNRSQLQVYLNDEVFTNYSFTPNKSINFSANITLKSGLNTLKITGTNQAGQDTDDAVLVYSRAANEDTGYPPTVNILRPRTNPFTSNERMQMVTAKVEHVQSKQEINVSVNGVNTTNFTYSNASKRVEFNANLTAGSNEIEVKAYNSFGNAKDKTIIVYKRNGQSETTDLPPQVKILTPARDPYRSSDNTINVIAETKHITQKNQIDVRINGVPTQTFTFNPGTRLIQFNPNLVAGNNIIAINATNNFGVANDQTTVVYRRNGDGLGDDSKELPKVEITTPNSNPYSSRNAVVNVVADIKNISNASQIDVKVNGQRTSNFYYNGMTKKVNLNVNLRQGSNEVSIKATNNYGNDIESVQIIYRKEESDQGERTPPKVRFVHPHKNPFTTGEHSIDFIAETEHIEQANQIEVKVNGALISNFNYTTTNQRIQFNSPLILGNNVVSIKVRNAYGYDTAETHVVYRKKMEGNPPKVNFIAPVNHPQVKSENYTMIAKVEGVNDVSQIDVYLNNQNVAKTELSYNRQTQTLQYLSRLKLGDNTFRINVRNNFGAHQAMARVKFVLASIDTDHDVTPKPCPPPKIRITQPSEVDVVSTKETFSISAMLENVRDRNDIEVFINGKSNSSFVFNLSKASFLHKIQLQKGKNFYKIVVKTLCGRIERKITINYTPVDKCGVEIDLGSSETDFCFTTDKGTMSQRLLTSNTNFNYYGKASSIYFKAKKKGNATVGGNLYPIIAGNYYHFKGNLTVNLKMRNGEWVLCVDADTSPLFGIGRSKPRSPCKTSEGGKGIVSPQTKPKPEVGSGKTPKINTRPKPSSRKPGRQKSTRPSNSRTKPEGR
ncbi:hypothetical protein CW751_02850 [Brumimicrobium salinarum]|uniref:Outer membrane protein beta-barrel domain-containing protein n=1 Tax=Brumimicrobium salinarum TaxID=2058658 RepID=A0A2I0R6S2_9FLAO|nr:hypothetical protein [Brumimicrobium salinarum]PKR82286.1 hypothetical protein CW751_02850 [Brumimicrobium salinarum]